MVEANGSRVGGLSRRALPAGLANVNVAKGGNYGRDLPQGAGSARGSLELAGKHFKLVKKESDPHRSPC